MYTALPRQKSKNKHFLGYANMDFITDIILIYFIRRFLKPS